MGLGHGRHTKVDTVCSMAWAREARTFGVGRAKRENLGGVGSHEARLHEDVLEMKVLLAQKPQKFPKGALRAGASRLPSSQH